MVCGSFLMLTIRGHSKPRNGHTEYSSFPYSSFLFLSPQEGSPTSLQHFILLRWNSLLFNEDSNMWIMCEFLITKAFLIQIYIHSCIYLIQRWYIFDLILVWYTERTKIAFLKFKQVVLSSVRDASKIYFIAAFTS